MTVEVLGADPVIVEVTDTVTQVEVRTHVSVPQAGGMWIETGLGPDGDDWTIWFEDGE